MFVQVNKDISLAINNIQQCCKNGPSLAQRQLGNADLNLAADDRRAEPFNQAAVIVSNIENIFRLFFVFWKLQSKSTWLKNLTRVAPP